MTKREEARIARLLAAIGHDNVIKALEHALRMRSTLRSVYTWGECRLDMWPKQVMHITDAALRPKR